MSDVQKLLIVSALLIGTTSVFAADEQQQIDDLTAWVSHLHDKAYQDSDFFWLRTEANKNQIAKNKKKIKRNRKLIKRNARGIYNNNLLIQNNSNLISINSNRIQGLEYGMKVLESDLSAGVAAAMAHSQSIARTSTGYRMGVAHYNNESAIAVGGRNDDGVTFSLSIDTSGNSSIAFGFDL